MSGNAHGFESNSRVSLLRRISDKLFYLLYPPKCICCGELLEPIGKYLCEKCLSDLKNEAAEGCLSCGKPFYSCRCKPEYLAGKRLVTALPYKEENCVTRELILYCKKKNTPQVFYGLASEMAEVLRKNGICDGYTVTYSPRSPKAVRGVSHDQAKELAKALSDLMELPMMPTLRCRETNMEQKALKPKKRLINAINRYRVLKKRQESIRGGKFIMVDDVVTSGATIARCAQILYDNGASDVICLCAARTVKYL